MTVGQLKSVPIFSFFCLGSTGVGVQGVAQANTCSLGHIPGVGIQKEISPLSGFFLHSKALLLLFSFLVHGVEVGPAMAVNLM